MEKYKRYLFLFQIYFLTFFSYYILVNHLSVAKYLNDNYNNIDRSSNKITHFYERITRNPKLKRSTK